MSIKEPLGKDEIHVWFCRPKNIRDPALLKGYYRLLSEQEAVQQGRFYFEKDRHTYLITRAMIRTLLSRYGDVQPVDWLFEKNEYGRPHIAPDQDHASLLFNISHTDGLIAIAFAIGRDIGVDVETADRDNDVVQLADRYFSANEVRDLHSIPEAEQKYRFFDYWTLKEAYIKARGMGLSIPLNQFSFDVMQPGTVAFQLDSRLGDRAQRWSFEQWWIDPSYKGALAVDFEFAPLNRIILREIVPLVGDAPFRLEKLRSNLPINSGTN